MAGYASGKRALAICDQCGFEYPLNSLRKEWTGFKVCLECYEPKHPQLEPKRSIDEPIALYEPRPEGRSTVSIYIGMAADVPFASIGMQPMPASRLLTAAGLLGFFTVRIT